MRPLAALTFSIACLAGSAAMACEGYTSADARKTTTIQTADGSTATVVQTPAPTQSTN